MYQYLKLNGFNDNVSAVSGTTTNAARPRRRAHLPAEPPVGFGRRRRHAVLHGRRAATSCRRARPSSAARRSRHLGRTWYELGVGVTAGFGKSGELYANAKIARNIGGDYRRGIVGQVGYRYSW